MSCPSLTEIRDAMAVIMMQRRQSTCQRQRDQAYPAIDVWRRLDAHLKRFDPRRHPAECAYHVDQYPHECSCGLTSNEGGARG